MADIPQPGIDPRILSLERDVSQPGRLTLQRDMFASVVVAQLIHHTSVRFKNPLRGNSRPIGVRAVNSRERISQSGVGALGPLKRIDQANTAQSSKGLPIESLDWDFSGDEIEIYAKFAAPQGMSRPLLSSTQSIANTTWTAVDFTSSADTGRLDWDIASPSRVTCGVAGVVLFTANAIFASNATGYREAYVSRAGSTSNRFGYVSQNATNGYKTGLSLSRMFSVSAGDYLELNVLQTSGGALNLEGSSAEKTSLCVQYVAPPASYTADVTLIIEGG